MNLLRSRDYFFLLLGVFLFIFQCGTKKKTKEELLGTSLNGTWRGQLYQKDLGLLDLELVFNVKEIDEPIGLWSTKSLDLSGCNQEIFSCEKFSCLGYFKYLKNDDGEIQINSYVTDGACWDLGIATITRIRKNSIHYKNVAPDNSYISGSLIRQ